MKKNKQTLGGNLNLHEEIKSHLQLNSDAKSITVDCQLYKLFTLLLQSLHRHSGVRYIDKHETLTHVKLLAKC